MTESFEKAVKFAAEKHAGQKRKGTDRPYITHPLKVKEILEDDNCEDKVIIAGILHDVLEDTDATPEEIEALFGAEVLSIIRAETEDKSKSWKERKSHTIEHLASAPLEVKLVCCADKLANLQDMADDYAEIGDKLWERFNAPDGKEDILWYYGEILNKIEKLKNYQMYKQYERLYRTFKI
jgi:myo-inositol-1(or 4)-monophosphatase